MGKKRRIICIETNEIFESQAAAAREMKLSVGNINSVLKGRRKQTCGCTFKYVDDEVNLSNEEKQN